MSKYKIEKGVPLLADGNIRSKYPFRDMEVGDSFLVELTKRPGCMSTASSFAAGQDPCWKFISRATSEDTARVWRVK